MSAVHNSSAVEYCRIEGPTVPPALEFQTFEFPLIASAARDLPATPGSLQRGDSGQATLLHFAPGHFLVPRPASGLIRTLDGLQASGVGAVFDVDGKWHAFRLTGRGAERVLSSTIDLPQALRHRDCAALHLFDCPAVVARRPDTFEAWVEASYASAFRECASQCVSRLAARDVQAG